MELRGIGTTRQRRLVGAIPPIAQENRVKMSITIDLTVGSRLNFFHEFPEAVFRGVAWNRYDMPTTSGRAHSIDSAREPGQKVHNYRSDRGSCSNFFHEFPDVVFDGFVWNWYDNPTVSGQGHYTDNTREPGQKVYN